MLLPGSCWNALLYSSDLEALTEAIRPPTEKLHRHGVESVRQRVTNLSDYSPLHEALGSAESLEDYLVRYFTDSEVKLTSGHVATILEMERKYQKY